ncbi:MAG: reverse transcriptase domain-containing protein [Minisyncoccota bacterium]
MNAKTIVCCPPGFTQGWAKGRVIFKPRKDGPVRGIHKSFLEQFGKVTLPGQADCVRPHLRNRFFLKLDLKDAFGSVSAFGAEVVLDLDFDTNWKYFFHSNGGLIQGAPASPIIFFLYCRETFEKELEAYCLDADITYTRYVDDLMFSSPERMGYKRRRALRDIIRKHRFAINEKKAMLVDNSNFRPVHDRLVCVGVEISPGHVRPKPEFIKKFWQEPRGTPQFEGMKAWRNQVLALNEKTK